MYKCLQEYLATVSVIVKCFLNKHSPTHTTYRGCAGKVTDGCKRDEYVRGSFSDEIKLELGWKDKQKSEMGEGR